MLPCPTYFYIVIKFTKLCIKRVYTPKKLVPVSTMAYITTEQLLVKLLILCPQHEAQKKILLLSINPVTPSAKIIADLYEIFPTPSTCLNYKKKVCRTIFFK
jgi:hypothetical protein